MPRNSLAKPKKETRGRPTLRTPETIRKIEEVAALDGSVEEMAYYAGVHPDSIYAWMKDDKDFSDRIKALRERPILKARQTVVKSLDVPQSAQWYIERKKKLEFSTRTESTNINLNIEDKPSERLQEIADKMRKANG